MLCSGPETMANPRWEPHGLWLTYDEQGKGTLLLNVATGTSAHSWKTFSPITPCGGSGRKGREMRYGINTHKPIRA